MFATTVASVGMFVLVEVGCGVFKTWQAAGAEMMEGRHRQYLASMMAEQIPSISITSGQSWAMMA